ncbi:MAG: prepilin peptidase [Microbacteriaceae bacterium]
MAPLFIVVALLGLAIGSFLNVVIHRVPAGISLVRPPSACPHCEAPIRPYDNIPVLSWLLLRAKCRNCGQPISARYPLVELGTAAFFLLVALRFLPPALQYQEPLAVVSALLVLAAFLYLASISVALAAIDLETHTLPNSIVLPAYVVSIVLIGTAGAVTGDWWGLLRAGIGLAAMWLVYFVMAIAYPGGMGFGDVKLAGVLGIYLGWIGWGTLAVGFFAAFVFGGLFSLVLLILRRVNRKSGIPFGPWMLVGAWFATCFGEFLWHGYLSLFGLA